VTSEPGFLRFFESRTGRFLRDHDLIQQDDRLLVASFCARDGLPLLDWLHRHRSRTRHADALSAAVVSLPASGQASGWRAALERVAAEALAPLHVLPSPAIGAPGCGACRADALEAVLRLAREVGATALALGDTLDDVAEDVLLGLVEAGELRSGSPGGPVDPGLRLVRPFAGTEARVVRRYARERGLPDAGGACPVDDPTRRLHLADVLAMLGGKPARLKFNLAHAARHVPVVTPARSR
jgi:tRNA(Ile)-lysidine synthase TilS/MesJ